MVQLNQSGIVIELDEKNYNLIPVFNDWQSLNKLLERDQFGNSELEKMLSYIAT